MLFSLGCCGATELNQLQKLQNRAARFKTNSSHLASARPIISELGWNTIDQLIAEESKLMVLKSLKGLAPPYMKTLFIKNLTVGSYKLRSTDTDLKLPLKTTKLVRSHFCTEGQKYGTESTKKLNRDLP